MIAPRHLVNSASPDSIALRPDQRTDVAKHGFEQPPGADAAPTLRLHSGRSLRLCCLKGSSDSHRTHRIQNTMVDEQGVMLIPAAALLRQGVESQTGLSGHSPL